MDYQKLSKELSYALRHAPHEYELELDAIMKQGLVPKGRQYVHLSEETKTALQVGKRRDDTPVILLIQAKKAWEDGVSFYHGNEMVWLADKVDSRYISIWK